MTAEERRGLQICVRGEIAMLKEDVRHYFPGISDGEIYDAIAQELERRAAATLAKGDRTE